MHTIKMCGSGKYPHPRHGRSLEILKIWGIWKTVLTESVKLNWSSGRMAAGFKQQNLAWACNSNENQCLGRGQLEKKTEHVMWSHDTGQKIPYFDSMVSNMKYESCKPRLLATVKLLAGMWLPCCPTPSCHVYAPGALPLPMITEKSNSWVLKSVVLCLMALWASWALLLILFLWDCLESTRQKQCSNTLLKF